MRILLVAEACNPEWTSVPLVGYNMAAALSRRDDLDVTVATHVRNRDAVLRSPLAREADVRFINNEWIAKPLYTLGKLVRGGKSLGWTTQMAINWPAYVAFERQIANHFKQQFQSREFDLIHRVTPVSPTMPSPLACWSNNTPMILGPMNGGLPWPKDYPELRKAEREWLAPVRNAYKHLPYYKATYRKLAAVIAGSRHTATEAPGCFNGERFYLPENGIDPDKFEIATDWTPPSEQFRFVAVGRLVPYKGFHLTLRAMAESPLLRQCGLDIIGDGPARQDLEALATELGLNDNVKFHGWVQQEDLGDELRKRQAFVFPSLREFGGGVVLEAMASGLPSIIVDYGGPAELVSELTGIALPMQPAEPLIRDVRGAMETLASDHDLCRRYSHAAIELIRNVYTWDAKARRIRDIYHDLLGHAPTESAAETGVIKNGATNSATAVTT